MASLFCGCAAPAPGRGVFGLDRDDSDDETIVHPLAPSAEMLLLPALPETYVPPERDGEEGLYFHEASPLARGVAASLEGLRSWDAWYKAPWWLRQGDVMTMYQALNRSADPVEYDRHEVAMLDGGVVGLDVLERVGGVAPPSPKETASLAVLVHGVGSSSEEPYVVNMAKVLAENGFAVLALNLRGSGDCPLKTPRFISFCRGTTDDIRVTIRYIREQILGGGARGHNAQIVLVGWSIGGSIVSNTLAEQTSRAGQGHAGRLSMANAGVVIGMPQDAAQAVANIEASPFQRMTYSNPLTAEIMDVLAEGERLFRGPVTRWPDHTCSVDVDFDEIAKSTCISELDAALTCKVYGYDSVQAYYEDSSPCNKLADVRVPLLMVNSADDPMSGGWVPMDEIRKNLNLVLVYTRYGGHNGWRDADDASRSQWLESVVCDFLDAVAGPRLSGSSFSSVEG